MATSRQQRRAAKRKQRRAVKKQPAVRKHPQRAQAVDDDLLAGLTYNAERAPHPAKWLAMQEQERLDCVSEYHRTALAEDRQPPNMSVHSGLQLLILAL